jgi:hypothetical protein
MRFFVLILKAYSKLIYFELFFARGNFQVLYDKVRAYPIRRIPNEAYTVEQLSAAMDMACIWYWKEVPCLQRSSATTCFCRDHAVDAALVIGVQQIPFKSHAWTEVDARVVNDRSYVAEIYTVLDRC